MDVVRERYGGEYGIFISGIYEKDRDFYRMRAKVFYIFSAGKAYEKYIKLLMGIMILAQFTAPLRAVLLDGEGELWEEVERFQTELEAAAGNIVWDYEEEMRQRKHWKKRWRQNWNRLPGNMGLR